MVDTSALEWPLNNGTNFPIIEGFSVDTVERFQWMVIVGGILAFGMAWGIGANDVANAFSTSVGAGSLSLRWACVIAAVMEFAGALLMGGSVTDTVRKKIIDVDVFDPAKEGGAANGPELLITGFLVALLAATIWLVTATYFSLPVSTTHSIIGALVGVGLSYRGASAVVWISEGGGLKSLKGVVGVIVSWVVSPILSAILAVIMFLVVRTAVLRRQNPLRNGFLFMPLFYGLTIAITIFFIIYKGDKRFSLSDKLSVGVAVGIAFGGGAIAAVISWIIIVPLAKRYVDAWSVRQEELEKNPEAVKEQVESDAKVDNALSKVGINVSIKEELDDDVLRMHDNVEKFDPKTERLFSWIQIFTAAFDSFAHGANDVANAIAPFASIFQLHANNGMISKVNTEKFESRGTFLNGELNGKEYDIDDKIPNQASYCGTTDDEDYFLCQTGDEVQFPYFTGPAPGAKNRSFDKYDDEGVFQGTNATCHTECNPDNAVEYGKNKQDVPIWILVLGGVGIVAGLAMWGYRIIVAIGVKLTKLTPSRGFSIELGAAVTVIIATRIGLPVSTTHCQVGATMGVGLVEFKKATVNWKQFIFICIGWVFTVIFTGLVSAGLFALMTNAPLAYQVDKPLNYCPGENLFFFNQDEGAFQGIGCSGFEN